MSYVVLARKWRPTQFKEVVGQGHIAQTLQNAIKMDRVAHSFLFTGARGVGKTSTARILAKALNCRTEGPTENPCETCSSCLEITQGRAVDVFEIDGASNRGINEIRELRESVRYAPSSERFKIYIIDEVHMLTTEAFNALLKTLEEPPPHAKFIFATTEPQKIPVTILSRCQRYDFKRISQADIVSHLEFLCREEKIEADTNALRIIARQATGGMRDALSLLDQIISFSGTAIDEKQVIEILGVANRKHLFTLSEAIVNHDVNEALNTIAEVDEYGYDLQQFTGEFVQHCRNLVVVASTEDPSRATDFTESEIVSAKETVNKSTIDLFHRMFTISSQAAVDMRVNTFPKVTLEMAVIQMTQLKSLVSLDLLIDRLIDLEHRFDKEPTKTIDRKSDAQRIARATPTSPKPSKASLAPVKDQVKSEPHEKITQPPLAKPISESALKPIPVIEAKPKKPAFGNKVTDANAPTISKDISKSAYIPDEEKKAESDLGLEEGNEKEQPLPAPLETLRIARLSPIDRWKEVVENLRYNRPLSMQCEHGFVDLFDEEKCVVRFAPEYAEFISKPKKLNEIHAIITALFGPLDFSALLISEIEINEKNMAIERDEERQARHDALTQNVKMHPIVKESLDLFEVPENDLQVSVKLFDD